MAEKKTDLKKLSYEQLEKEADALLSKLNDESLPLDEANKLYQYGLSLSNEMEERLAALTKSVSDTISRE